MKPLYIFISFFMSLCLSACGGDDVDDIAGDGRQLYINFDESIEDWQHGFSDYTAKEADYGFTAEQAILPPPLDLIENQTVKRKGYKLASNNRSGDVFMFITREYKGLEANTLYDFDFELTFATNAQKNCMGIGGAPGEAVTIKAGASKTQPKSVNNGNDNFSMNIDKGNQSTGGLDAIALGDFANDRECGDQNTQYMKKTLKTQARQFSAYTDNNGRIWILFGTDSGFEGTTTIYFMQAKVWARKRLR